MADATKTVVHDIPMALKKETKGTFVYAADLGLAPDAVVTQLYVQRSAFPAGAPATIMVTITA